MYYIERLEVQDEQLNGTSTFRLRDSNGNIIYDSCTLEQITEVLKNGTPVNKVLFDKIDDRFDKVMTIINGMDFGEEYMKMLLTTEVGPLGIYTAVNEENFDSWDDSNAALLKRIEKLEKRVSALE